MANERRIRWDIVFKTILSISLVITGICLIAGCLTVYYSGGDHPYSHETVAQAFKMIQLPVFLSLALIVLSFVGALTAPESKKKSILKPNAAQLLRLYTEKRDIAENPELALSVAKERQLRKKFTICTAVANCLSAIVFLFYALNPTHFDRADINGSMISAMLVLTPCLAFSFSVSFIFHILAQKSQQREIELLKKAPLKATPDNDDAVEKYNKQQKTLLIVKIVLLSVFLALAVLGFIMGGTDDVLTKAVNICTECIGLG